MKVLATNQDRREYIETQIRRSERKFKYCKVSVHDADKYRTVLGRVSGLRPAELGPVLCLGTRNGREVDLFRLQWFGSRWIRWLSRQLERRTHSFTSWMPPMESVGRSAVAALNATSVIGVELNPQAARRDIWIGSFDQMPPEWNRRFRVAFSNSFDQSQDPERTAREWKRVLQPGGFLIVCFDPDQEPTVTDPVGGLSVADVQTLFGGRLVYATDRGSRNGYSEAILQL